MNASWRDRWVVSALVLALLGSLTTAATADEFKCRYYHSEAGSFQAPYTREQYRLIVFHYQGPSQLKAIARAFQQAADNYEARNVTYSFGRQFRSTDLSPLGVEPARHIVAGFYNYDRGEYGFIVIRSVGDVNGSGFRYALNTGEAYKAYGDSWVTRWWKLEDWELDWSGGIDRIGVQVGHHRGNSGEIRLGFRLDRQTVGNSP